MLSSLQLGKVAGYDAINIIILKDMKDIKSTPLTGRFNASLSQGIYLNIRNDGDVTAIH